MSSPKLLRLLQHVDLPGHDSVVKMAQRANKLESVALAVSFIAPPLMAFLALWFLNTVGGANVEPRMFYVIPGAIAATMVTGAAFAWIIGKTSLRMFCSAIFFLVAVGLFIAFALAGSFKDLATNDGAWDAFWTGLVIAGGAVVGAWALVISFAILAMVASPLNFILFGPLFASMRRSLRRDHKAWIGRNGHPIVSFDYKSGFYRLATGDLANPRVYVLDPNYRSNGKAPEAGHRVFTYQEVSNVLDGRALTAAAGAAVGAEVVYDDLESALGLRSDDSTQSINPATGLPTIAGPGSMDVAGNLYGTTSNDGFSDINPASGLPTVSGIGSIDVGGNSYGTTDSGGGFDNRF